MHLDGFNVDLKKSAQGRVSVSFAGGVLLRNALIGVVVALINDKTIYNIIVKNQILGVAYHCCAVHFFPSIQ